MASGNSSGIGTSLFRGALHGNTSNTNNSNVNSNHHHQQPHHHSASLHNQQGVGASNQAAHQSQSQSQTPAQPQPQSSVGSSYSSEEPRQTRGTPGVRESPDHMSTLMAKLWFDHNVESSLSSLKKEEHEKRTKDLRKQLEYIADTNWKYLPVEKYIGQQ